MPPGWNAAVVTDISDLMSGCQSIKGEGVWAADNSIESRHHSGFNKKDKQASKSGMSGARGQTSNLRPLVSCSGKTFMGPGP